MHADYYLETPLDIHVITPLSSLLQMYDVSTDKLYQVLSFNALFSVNLLLTLRETAPSDFNGLSYGLPTARRELLSVAICGTSKHDVIAIGRSGRTLTGWIVLQWAL